MPNDFKILPLPPEPVSGHSLIHQIEKVVNDLGTQYDEIETVVIQKANQALQTAQNAESIATTALETALDAESLANRADNQAGKALNKADQADASAKEALIQANTAYDLATIAITDSGAALDLTVNASNKAEAALTQSKKAEHNADQALIIAQGAYQLAYEANGIFKFDDLVRDADEAFELPEKSYLINEVSSGFPPPLSFPCYFEVLLADNEEAVTQRCWDAADGPFHRTGIVDRSDPENPTATWTSWHSSVSGDIPRGVIVLWSGSVNDIPFGWALCDGNNATPDLTDKFIVGAGAGYSPDDFGGDTNHEHNISGSVEPTTLDVSQIPPHAHSALRAGGIEVLSAGRDLPFLRTSANAGGGKPHDHPLSLTSDAATSLPPYYALAYIMKL